MSQNTRNFVINHLSSDLDSSFAATARRNTKRQTKSIKRAEFTRRQQQEVENERREREKHARTLAFFVANAARKEKTTRQTQKKTTRQTHVEAKRRRAHEEIARQTQKKTARQTHEETTRRRAHEEAKRQRQRQEKIDREIDEKERQREKLLNEYIFRVIVVLKALARNDSARAI